MPLKARLHPHSSARAKALLRRASLPTRRRSCSSVEAPSRLKLSLLSLLGARAEAELRGRGQRRGLVVFAQSLFHLLAAREPARDGEIISREHAREPVRPILF